MKAHLTGNLRAGICSELQALRKMQCCSAKSFI
jgi:hypothetical protein